MNTAVDNIEVDPETGDLWIGCHPVMYNIAERLRAPGIDLPSNVGITNKSFPKLITSNPKPGPEVIKKFMLNSAEHEIFPAHKC